MKLFFFLLVATTSLFAKSLAEKLSDLPDGYSYRLLGNDIIELTDNFGLTRRLDLCDITVSALDTSDQKIIKIALVDIDTTGFSKKMSYMMTLPIGKENSYLIAGDSDNDGLIELVGRHISEEPNSSSTQIYEKVSLNSDEFQLVYTYPWRMTPLLTADINQNGRPEYWFRKTWDHQDDYFAYESLSDSGLAILPIIHFFRGGANFSYPRVADFDDDGHFDMVHNGGDGDNYFEAVAEYDPATKAMSNVWRHPSISSPVGGQWSVGDFDRDGRLEFVNGHMKGIVFWYEHTGKDNGYEQVFFDTLFYNNVYYNTEGDDIDGDGRMEVFIGGSGYYQEVWSDFITCYERIGDNQFEKSVELWVRGMGGWNAPFIRQADVDGDGTNELVWSAGNSVAVIKNIGDDDYEIWWYKHFPKDVGATTADLDNDGNEEILVSYRVSVPNSIETRTEIYTLYDSSTVLVQDNGKIDWVRMPQEFELNPNFPNPFNDQTVIAYKLTTAADVRLSIYSTTGKEVKQLYAGFQPSGQNRLTWDGTNDLGEKVSTGVYVLRLTVGAEQQIRKMLFIQ